MKNQIEKDLKALGFQLPSNNKSVGNYIPYLIEENILYISGQLPIIDGKVIYKGKINNKKKIFGYKASQVCAVNIIGQVNIALKGNFKKISKCLKLGGFVNSEKNFSDHPYIINGASELICKIFKNKGKHTRFAIGVNSLPLDASVEIDAMFSLKN